MRRTTIGCLFLVLALLGLTLGSLSASGAVRFRRSRRPPRWAYTEPLCVLHLASAAHPGGVRGYFGYSAYVLDVVRDRDLTCERAKRLAYRDWVNGPRRQPLRWRYLRAWRSTSGQGYIGDFTGRKKRVQVEYLAVH